MLYMCGMLYELDAMLYWVCMLYVCCMCVVDHVLNLYAL
jgi:hypothetical protein